MAQLNYKRYIKNLICQHPKTAHCAVPKYFYIVLTIGQCDTYATHYRTFVPFILEFTNFYHYNYISRTAPPVFKSNINE